MQRENALSPTPLRRAETQSPHKAPPMLHVFSGWGLGAFQWQVHYIYLVSKSEKELFFREGITSEMYRISRINYETHSADITEVSGGWNFKTKWFPDVWVNITDDELSREWHLVEW